MARQRLVDRYSQRPAGYRYPAYQGFRWYLFYPDALPVHIIGRTVPGLETMASPEEVEDLADSLGYVHPRGWESLSGTQRLDFMATWIIQRSLDGAQSEQSAVVLSFSQFASRVRREIPMSTEAMDALLVHHPDRLQIYRGGATSTETTLKPRKSNPEGSKEQRFGRGGRRRTTLPS